MVEILLARPEGPEDRGHDVRIALSPGTPADALARFKERFGVECTASDTQFQRVYEDVLFTEDSPEKEDQVMLDYLFLLAGKKS